MPRSRRPSIRFEVDPRLELLGALLMLARPRRAQPSLPYADKVLRHFSPLSEHPLPAEFARLLDRGVPGHLFTELLLLGPDAGGLMTPELSAFFDRFRAFGELSDGEAFFGALNPDHAGFIALARAEAAKSQQPEAVSAYLRMPFSRTYRLILAPLLTQAFAVNVSRGEEELRVRNGFPNKEGLAFEFDEFDCCVAHELTHTVLTPLIAGSRPIFDAYPGAPPKTCRDAASWSGCVEEHLVRAITLRALKLSGDEKSYRTTLRRWARSGYPYLEDFCLKLEGFERSPKSSDFADFYPGLVAAFEA